MGDENRQPEIEKETTRYTWKPIQTLHAQNDYVQVWHVYEQVSESRYWLFGLWGNLGNIQKKLWWKDKAQSNTALILLTAKMYLNNNKVILVAI